MPKSVYLGDAVYASWDVDGNIILTTGSHRREEAGNLIFLEPAVQEALLKALQQMKGR